MGMSFGRIPVEADGTIDGGNGLPFYYDAFPDPAVGSFNDPNTLAAAIMKQRSASPRGPTLVRVRATIAAEHREITPLAG